MSDIHALTELGWTPHWQGLFAPHGAAGLVAGRVIRGDRTSSLVSIPGHGVIIDTPGLRAIGLTGDEDGLARAEEHRRERIMGRVQKDFQKKTGRP